MEITYEAGQIVIRVPATDAQIKGAPFSSSGKTRLIASTGGFMAVPGAPQGVKINLAITAPK
jgi:hypothetical protein